MERKSRANVREQITGTFPHMPVPISQCAKMIDMKMIKDPLGHEVFIKENILLSNRRIMQSEELLDDISAVIEKPMMIFKMKRDAAQFYYLRAVGWNKTMLLSVYKNKDHFEVINYEIDPPLQRFSELYGDAERLV